MSDANSDQLKDAARKFILHWGEMGTRWGINRTVAQIHALLLVSSRPLAADEITDTLEIARSNVSTSLRELQNWGIVRLVHVPGDRRDHFESLKDVYEMFRIIARERRRREIDPTIGLLRDCIAEAGKPKSADTYTRDRLAQLLEFFELATSSFDLVEKLPTKSLLKIAKMGDKAVKYRDVAFAVSFLLQAFMYMSPVIYPLSLVPERLQVLYQLNPMTGVIQGFRWALLGIGEAPGLPFVISLGLTLSLLVSGAFIFRRTERTIVDLL